MPQRSPFESVLTAASQGAEWAWVRIVNDLDGMLRIYVRRNGAIDVDDVIGETWLHVARRLVHFSGDERDFRSWVFMVAHHRIIDERRRVRRRPLPCAEEAIAEETNACSPSAEDEAVGRLAEEELLSHLQTLSRDQREVILLRFVAGFGVAEIARIMGKTPGAVQALQRRALKRLEKELRQSGKQSA
ncbi:MAG: RNA polymerase sigma factor [Coriobacteriia bacterium]